MPALYFNESMNWAQKNGVDHPVVGLVGLSYKGDTNDLRNTPMIEVYRLFAERTQVRVHDPHVSEAQFEELAGCPVDFSGLRECFEGAHVVVFGCAHSSLPAEKIENADLEAMLDLKAGFGMAKIDSHFHKALSRTIEDFESSMCSIYKSLK